MASINSPHVSIGNNMNAYSGRSTVSPSLTGRSSPNFGEFVPNIRREISQSDYVKCRKIDFAAMRKSADGSQSSFKGFHR